MKIEVANGELVDKVTILSIKLKKIESKEKLVNIRKEYRLLSRELEKIGIAEKSETYQALFQINSTLWDVEDEIRVKEKNREFDDVFIQLARRVYFENDRRSDVKRRINIETGSNIIEEKAYADYQRS